MHIKRNCLLRFSVRLSCCLAGFYYGQFSKISIPGFSNSSALLWQLSLPLAFLCNESRLFKGRLTIQKACPPISSHNRLLSFHWNDYFTFSYCFPTFVSAWYLINPPINLTELISSWKIPQGQSSPSQPVSYRYCHCCMK
jgi:hypothetical protein